MNDYLQGYIDGLRDARDAFQKEYRKPEDIINELIIVKHYTNPQMHAPSPPEDKPCE